MIVFSIRWIDRKIMLFNFENTFLQIPQTPDLSVILIIATVRIMKLKQAYGFKLRPKWKY